MTIFLFRQILNNAGFTLDTSDFPDLLDDDEEVDYSKNIQLSNEEMLRLLNLEEEDDNDDKIENDSTPFIGIAFDMLRPKMESIYENGEVDISIHMY